MKLTEYQQQLLTFIEEELDIELLPWQVEMLPTGNDDLARRVSLDYGRRQKALPEAYHTLRLF